MILRFMPGEAWFIPEVLETKAIIQLESGAFTASHLLLKAKVIGIDEGVLQAVLKKQKFIAL